MPLILWSDCVWHLLAFFSFHVSVSGSLLFQFFSVLVLQFITFSVFPFECLPFYFRTHIQPYSSLHDLVCRLSCLFKLSCTSLLFWVWMSCYKIINPTYGTSQTWNEGHWGYKQASAEQQQYSCAEQSLHSTLVATHLLSSNWKMVFGSKHLDWTVASVFYFVRFFVLHFFCFSSLSVFQFQSFLVFCLHIFAFTMCFFLVWCQWICPHLIHWTW